MGVKRKGDGGIASGSRAAGTEVSRGGLGKLRWECDTGSVCCSSWLGELLSKRQSMMPGLSRARNQLNLVQ